MEHSSLIFLILSCSLCYVFAFSPKQEVCLLQVDEGPCKVYLQRYYYNTFTQQCEAFVYGGCEGNANNFKTFLSCLIACFRIPKIPQICRFQKDAGPCEALMPSYFFNIATMQCEQFDYGGCQGNENRFQDQLSCKEYCRPQSSYSCFMCLTATHVLCLDPLDKGGCAASIPRYYYNSASRMCEQFIYSGCGGSSNNFISRQSCIDICAKAGKPWISRKTGRRAGMMRTTSKNRIRIKPNNNIKWSTI
ncbi:tissue factor pathway inhibitor 2-like [Oncorhynchus masou masou]|uniref:tissue factor pathway inhibitor 2-like n=1 Tax=Oncorhynchus masou masou TaxID=90313 RepID=UPI003183FB3F